MEGLNDLLVNAFYFVLILVVFGGPVLIIALIQDRLKKRKDRR